jgi:hypothetical protein
MTIQRFFLDGFGSEEELATLKAADVFPLVRELQFKHGLKVLRAARIGTNQGGWGEAYQLCSKTGIAVAKVWTEKNDDGRLEFCYRSPYYQKERGRNVNEKSTIHSVKVSSMMASLTRHNVVPKDETLTNKKVAGTKTAMSLMRQAIGDSTKRNDLTANEVHALIAKVLGEPDSDHLLVDLHKCKNILDKYKEVDRIQEEKRQEIARVFRNPYYMIGVDELNHLIIGKFKIVKQDGFDKYEYETLEPFKRYPNVEAYPELIPLMTMIKVAYESNDAGKQGIFPLIDKYDPNLDVAFFFSGRPSHYDCLWMTTPC